MNDIVPFFGLLAVLGTCGWMLKLTLNYRTRMNELDRAKMGRLPSDERLERVEQAVEAIAIEIERVSEGQRFVTKLLNERAQPRLGDAGVPVQARKIDTPH
jgi:hypothetical protein